MFLWANQQEIIHFLLFCVHGQVRWRRGLFVFFSHANQ